MLILAGDIYEANQTRKEFKAKAGVAYQFFMHVAERYKRVFYVLGNHEHYGCRVDKSFKYLREVLPSNVIVLENQSEVYKDVLFVGATLWTDMNRRHPYAIHDSMMYMSDYRKIQFHDKRNDSYGKLHPHDTVDMHYESVKYIRDAIDSQLCPIVVITHHAPTMKSVARSNGVSHTDYAYASDLSDIILDSTIDYWIHGHTHDQTDYVVGATRVLSNPRGYFGYEAIANNFAVAQIELEVL